MLIAPEMDAETVREQVRRYGFVGLKPYHLMAKTDGPTFLAPIEDYLSEEHVRVALHEEGLTITLHMVRDRAVGRPGEPGDDPPLLHRLPQHAADLGACGTRL